MSETPKDLLAKFVFDLFLYEIYLLSEVIACNT